MGWREGYFLHFINVHRPDGARAFFIFLLKFFLFKSLFVPLFLLGFFSTFLTRFYSSVSGPAEGFLTVREKTEYVEGRINQF